MIIELIQYLTQFESNFSFFYYLTVRGVFIAITSFLLSIFLCRWVINFSHKHRIYPGMRADGPDHEDKQQTPILGGVAMCVSIVLSSLLWVDLSHFPVWLCLLTVLLYALIGGLDDYLKVKHQDGSGLSVRAKLALQSCVAVGLAWVIFDTAQTSVEVDLLIPYVKNTSIALGWWFIPFSVLVIVGTSNSVNLMDGLDGLCILPVAMITVALAIFLYFSGNIVFASYLNIPYIAGNGELALIALALVGAGMGFLWYNSHPAQVFMGDVGSLSIGALMALLAIFARQELVLAVMGGLFVVQTFSVFLQVGSYKLRGKRIFKMAPLHHHYEKLDYQESKIIIRFWIVTFFFVILGLASLKIR